MPERAVFDTNIWISGLLWRGKPYQCLLLARAGLVQIVYCQQIVAELPRKLRTVRELIEQKRPEVLKRLPGGEWDVHYAFFSRAGFTDAARTRAEESGALLVDLERLDADLIAAAGSATSGSGEPA